MKPTPGITQAAPWSNDLADLVDNLEYRVGWSFRLSPNLDRGQGSVGTTLSIRVMTTNSYPPHQTMSVMHYFPVPPAAYIRSSWQRWLLDTILLVERHEACEFFTIAGVKPYAPNHGPGEDPYIVHDYATEEAAATTFTGAPAGKGRQT